jgi:hypothetical protein
MDIEPPKHFDSTVSFSTSETSEERHQEQVPGYVRP